MSEDHVWGVIESKPTRKLFRGPVTDSVQVETREGVVTAEPGDYIIQESDGNCYPISEEKINAYYRWIPGGERPYEPQSESESESGDGSEGASSSVTNGTIRWLKPLFEEDW